MELPPPPKIPFLRKALKPLWAYLSRTQLVAGEGITLHEDPGGGVLLTTALSTDEKPSHPWKCTANGTDTIKIAAGEIFKFTPGTTGSLPNEPFNGGSVDYAGEDFVVSASGTLYAVVECDSSVTISADSYFGIGTAYLSPDSVSVEMDPSPSGTKLTIPIADIDFTDDIATVTKQRLTHNPMPMIHFAEGFTP